MPRFSANIATMFTQSPLLDRVAAASKAGFKAVEFQFVHDLDPKDLRRAKDDAGVAVSVFNLPQGDLTSGGPGLSAMPGREVDFRAAVDLALGYAEALGTRNVNILPGWPPADIDRAACRQAMVKNVAYAGKAFADIGVRVVVEALNTRDRPGCFLSTSAQTLSLIDEAGHENLSLEYDLYHMQIMEGDLIATLEKLMPRIGHIQFADPPGRHEPGTGEINFPAVFAAIDRFGYDGWVGAEYVPTGLTEDSLTWMNADQ